MRGKWNTDPFAYGSYSHFPVGSKPGDCDALAASMAGCIHFLGEATIKEHFGTVHGVYLSGLRAARAVAGAR